jgi:ZIP family zinc transporter
MFDAADRYALLLSLLAGLATTVGGLIAVWRKPDQKLLAFLLGTAVGVMATLSVVELYVKNVLENGFVGITLATACGAMVYVVVEPLLPKAEVLEARGALADAVGTAGPGGRIATDGDPESTVEKHLSSKMSKARLMRLGLLMAITMTLHNLPEGFAVAFSSYTSVGPVMAAAIGVHNVPEGIIVAAPVFAATGSRKRARGCAFGAVLHQAVPHTYPAAVPARLDRGDDERGVFNRAPAGGEEVPRKRSVSAGGPRRDGGDARNALRGRLVLNSKSEVVLKSATTTTTKACRV